MSLCSNRSFSDERGPGTFHSMGTLPKRKSIRKSPVFHIAHDDDDDDHPSHDSHPVPFPRATSPPSPTPSSPSPPATPPPPPLLRGVSTPILLPSGKPLKSSLKSSSSSPAMLTPPQHMHFRARSEPSTPATTPKNVHFPEKDYALATVRFFNCKARPAALSNPTNSNGDETETEGEETPPTRFPFPRVSPILSYEINPSKSSLVPTTSSCAKNIRLSSLSLSCPSPKPLLIGSIIVRNLAFEKHLAVRFTLDDWQTVSEVSAHYVDSPSLPPSHILPSPSFDEHPTSPRGKGWDRFAFTIHLEDYAPSLSTRTMWLAARYRVHSTYPLPNSTQYGPGGEWWDNNDGKNYRVAFRPAVSGTTPPKIRPRHETVSAPVSSPRSQPQPPATSKEHVLGLMVPSIARNGETEPGNKTNKPPALRIGKLSLCNYVPPKPPVPSPQNSPSFPNMHLEMPSSVASRLPLDDESASPPSSALCTPTSSPTISPRVILGGQPATYSESLHERDDDAVRSSKHLHVVDWEWSAPNKSQLERLARQRADILPVSDALSSCKAPTDDPLYDAFVTHWCFSQGPSPNHCGFGDGGILT